MGRLSSIAGRWHRLQAARLQRGLQWSRPTYAHPVRRWLVLQSGPNPSTDYYIRPRAADLGVPVQVRDIGRDAPQASDFAAGTQVMVVRYLARRWADALRRHADALAGVVYFMDDDLIDPAAWRGLPPAYHDKLARHFGSVGADIAALASQVWVSTPALRDRHPELQALVVPPLPLVDDAPRPIDADGAVRLFYHGTQAHDAEIRWLRPVIAACLDACPQAHFEIIGPQAVNQLYRELPRTRVLHPMSWPNYLAHCRTMHGHIGLAPLLDSGFNAGRSHTKVMDVARCGAAGVYTRVAPYDAIVSDGVDGVLLNNAPQVWVDRIVGLVHDRTSLLRMQRSAAKRFLRADPVGLTLDAALRGLSSPERRAERTP